VRGKGRKKNKEKMNKPLTSVLRSMHMHLPRGERKRKFPLLWGERDKG